MIKHFDITIQGKVQGVWFRDSTQKEAQKHGIKGFVRNEPDGSVHIEAEGNPGKLDEFVKWCHAGPEKAVVANVDMSEGDLKHFNEFIVSN